MTETHAEDFLFICNIDEKSAIMLEQSENLNLTEKSL